jgi:predicted RNase H-like nuclease
VNISEYNLVHSGHKDVRQPTVGWISQFLDFEKRTLDLKKFCDRKYEGYMRKRLVPLVEKDFDHFSGGATEPVPEFIYVKGEEIEVEKRLRPTEDFPEYEKEGFIHRQIEVFPVCATLGMLTTPPEKKKKSKKPLDEVGKKKREKIHEKAEKRKANIPEASKKRWGKVRDIAKKQLLDKYISEPEDVDYVSKVVLKLVRRRVQSAGNLYTRVNKKSFNENLKVARARHKKMAKNLKAYSVEFSISKRAIRSLKKERDRHRESDKIQQETCAVEYITPYGATWVRDNVVEETERFKYFLLRRRLTDYGISWKNSDLSRHNTTKNRFYSNNMDIPYRLRNLMRNIIVIHRNQEKR